MDWLVEQFESISSNSAVRRQDEPLKLPTNAETARFVGVFCDLDLVRVDPALRMITQEPGNTRFFSGINDVHGNLLMAFLCHSQPE